VHPTFKRRDVFAFVANETARSKFVPYVQNETLRRSRRQGQQAAVSLCLGTSEELLILVPKSNFQVLPPDKLLIFSEKQGRALAMPPVSSADFDNQVGVCWGIFHTQMSK
jgi:hypothetical protein